MTTTTIVGHMVCPKCQKHPLYAHWPSPEAVAQDRPLAQCGNADCGWIGPEKECPIVPCEPYKVTFEEETGV